MHSDPSTGLPPGLEPSPTFPYRLQHLVGEGAMGRVYLGVEQVLERPVAVKVLKPEHADASRSARARENRLRFLQEAKAAASLSHPNVATVYRVGEEAGEPYLVMEWLPGQTLDALVRNEGPRPVSQVVRLGLDLLSALAAAHQAGVIHRDIKPANLVLLPEGRLKVTDFGIARLLEGELVETQAGQVFATPLYASPEQLRGEPVGPTADLFAVGAVLYFLLTGREAFAGRSFMDIAQKILFGEPQPLEALRPGLPPALTALVRRALARRQEDRFQSAEAMAQALAEVPVAEARAGSGAATAVPASVAADPEALTLSRLAPRGTAWVEAVVARWPGRPVPAQSTRALLARLLEDPLHVAPFAGALSLGQSWLLLANGQVMGACRSGEDWSGDRVVEELPHQATGATLHAAPQPEAARWVAALASWLHPPKVRLAGLDSGLINLPVLGDRLLAEGFDGTLELERQGGVARLLWVAGRPRARVFAGSWTALPIASPWQELVSALPVLARVEEAAVEPLAISYRHAFAERELQVVDAKVSRGGEASPTGLVAEHDPLARFLAWALERLPAVFAERGKTAAWKYLVGWLAEVAKARLYHQPDAPVGPTFDLATYDGGGRILHLARRAAHVSASDLESFVAEVTAVKSARAKTGDIGGALLVAQQFAPDALANYRSGRRPSDSGRFLAVEESLTGYEGFVRIGARRGFHLLLVQETAAGFEVMLP